MMAVDLDSNLYAIFFFFGYCTQPIGLKKV